MKVVARDEDKDAWRSYLARHDFARALSHCVTAAQREEVHCAQAERAMAVNDAGKAARCYAKAGDFIDADVVVNIFKDAHEVDALETYLRRRLELREADGAPAVIPPPDSSPRGSWTSTSPGARTRRGGTRPTS